MSGKAKSYKSGVVISITSIANGRYKHHVIRLAGAQSAANIKEIRDFIFSNVNAILPNAEGERVGTICDAKSYGKDDIPNKSAKLEPFGANWGEPKPVEEDESELDTDD